MLLPENKTPSTRYVSGSDGNAETEKFNSRSPQKLRGDSQSKTAFEQVLEKKKKLKKGNEDVIQNDSPNVSIFDLSSKGNGDAALLEAAETQNPSIDHKLLADAAAVLNKDSLSDKDASISKFSQEQPDISSFNPYPGGMMAAGFDASAISGAVQQGAAASSSQMAEMRDLIDQVIDKIYTLKSNGQTDTVITLKNPPVFAGADLVISAFDQAKGQFNIAFHNLTQAAQDLLNMQNNQNILRHALEQKGYLVHIVIISTNPIELNLMTDGGNPSREEQSGDEQGRGNQQQNRDQKKQR